MPILLCCLINTVLRFNLLDFSTLTGLFIVVLVSISLLEVWVTLVMFESLSFSVKVVKKINDTSFGRYDLSDRYILNVTVGSIPLLLSQFICTNKSTIDSQGVFAAIYQADCLNVY